MSVQSILQSTLSSSYTRFWRQHVIFGIIRLMDFCSPSLVRINNEQDRHCAHDVMPWCIRINIVVIETQQWAPFVSLSYISRDQQCRTLTRCQRKAGRASLLLMSAYKIFHISVNNINVRDHVKCPTYLSGFNTLGFTRRIFINLQNQADTVTKPTNARKCMTVYYEHNHFSCVSATRAAIVREVHYKRWIDRDI